MPRKWLSDGDHLQAKKELTEKCPFCLYTGRSNNVRRHTERYHATPKDVIGKTLPNSQSFTVLDAEHPNIVIASAEKGDCYHKHQAYCFGCHHRILCKSKVLEKAIPDCLEHVCTEKQVRNTSRESSVAEPPSVKWKEFYDQVTKSGNIKATLQEILEYEDAGEPVDYEDRIHCLFTALGRKAARYDIMMRSAALDLKSSDDTSA
jgi:hypothetical protein